ncbi:MAG: trypsin-like serine protease [Deltaproteobacteria bacterium]|nr:trypsin-like serine protease [Deltaproteobacteria bacterium]
MRILLLSLLVSLLGTSCQSIKASQPKVTNGIEEPDFPYVVQIQMNGRSYCTGSFLNDSLLLTAAHCVDRASFVKFGNVSVESEFIFIHPRWPSGGESCKLPRDPRYDLAYVKFPKGTYSGPTFGKVATQSARPNEEIKIVGFGNSLITPFDRFCYIPRAKDDDGH